MTTKVNDKLQLMSLSKHKNSNAKHIEISATLEDSTESFSRNLSVAK